ncbi:unnamed protein product [Rhizoctonia solani]|nr:unnamed protein product [Rhizoctonia solani]
MDEFNRLTRGLTDQFNAIYGKDPDDIAWRNLCSALDLAEIPTEVSACKKLIKFYVDIVDLVDQPVTDVHVGYFRTEHGLAKYTWKIKKVYNLQAVKTGGLLIHLPRFINQPRRKYRSRPKLRKA